MKSIYRTILAVAGSFLRHSLEAGMLRWKRWSASWQLTGSQEVFCFLLFLKRVPKSENGTLESRAGWKGLCRKGMMLFFVLVAEKLDQLTQTNYLSGCRLHWIYFK